MNTDDTTRLRAIVAELGHRLGDCYGDGSQPCQCTVCTTKRTIKKLVCLYELEHFGVHVGRLIGNVRERLYAEEWLKENTRQRGHLTRLELILQGYNATPHEPTARDAEVAASVIQWLGTTVGQNFLETVQRRIDAGESPKWDPDSKKFM
jgi:hypothetical protein